MQPVFSYDVVDSRGPARFCVNVVIRLLRNSRYLYDVQPGTCFWRLSRILRSGYFGLGDYGLVPRTLQTDGSEMRALVLVSEPSLVGCLMESRVIGSIKLSALDQESTVLICVPVHEKQRFQGVTDVEDLDPMTKVSIKRFFENGDPIRGSNLRFHQWESLSDTWNGVEEAFARFVQDCNAHHDTFEGGHN